MVSGLSRFREIIKQKNFEAMCPHNVVELLLEPLTKMHAHKH